MGDSLVVLLVILVLAAPFFAIAAYVIAVRLRNDVRALNADAVKRWELLELKAALGQYRPTVGHEPAQPPPVAAPEPTTPALQSDTLEVPVAVISVPEPAMPAHAAPSPVDWESVIGGKWLNAVGLVAVLLATAFFLKFAFDNDWIGPIGRIAIGLVAGTALLVASEFMLRRGWTYFSEGLTALGAGILYLSLYAAWNLYRLLPPNAAFGGMVVVTAALIALSLARDSQRLGILALVGGYLTPLLVSTGQDAQIPLFSYLILLNAGLLSMAVAKDWRSMPGSFVFALLYGLVWYQHFYEPAKLWSSLVFATIFFVQFSMLPAIQARRAGTLRPDAIILTLANAAWYLFALDAMLYDTHRWVLTAAVLAIAAFYLVLANVTAVKSIDIHPAARPIFGSVALTCITVAIPIRLEGQWIAMAWALEGAILIWNGFRANAGWLRVAGLVLLAAVLVDLQAFPVPAGRPFLNGRFLTLAVVAVAFGVSAWMSRRSDRPLVDAERTAFSVTEIAGNAVALLALSSETWSALDSRSTSYGEWPPVRLFGVTIVWAAYAVALALIGLLTPRALARYQAYVLFVLVLAKAMFLDLVEPFGGAHPLVSVRLLTSAFVFATLALTLFMSARLVERLPAGERPIVRAFGVALNAFAVWALSVEAWQAAAPGAHQFALSLVWVVYAGILIVIGVRRDSLIVRWQALALFGLVVLKAVFVDLSLLAIGYRIASFFALGVILLGASFLYQRRLFGERQRR